jgi:hypothetical protein
MTLTEAIAKARAEMKAPKMDKEASMGQGRTYRYASLASVLDSVLPALTKHGITLLQPCSMGDGVVSVTTQLQLGEQTVETTLSAPLSRGGFHEMGSAITYLRRYGLSSLLAICADEDEDGHAAEAAAQAAPKRAPSRDRRRADKGAVQPRAEQQPGNLEVLRGVLEKVFVTNGKKKDGTPWCRRALRVEGFDTWIGTFDERMGQKAEDLEGAVVRLKVIADGKSSSGWSLDWIEEDAADPQAIADAAIAADKADVDDLPF